MMLLSGRGKNLTLSSVVLVGLFALSLIWSFAVFVVWIDIPVLDSFGFRQAQTAISAFYMLKDGIALDYQTPVLGQPWSIPFEFPSYQILTALVASLGISVDIAGRVVSYGFFVACLLPLRSILLSLGFRQEAFHIVATLFLSSSLYVFWSRTVMIESAALFFCVLWLMLVLRYIFAEMSSARSMAWTVVGALVAGTLGVLTKATTFPAFCVVGCLFALLQLWRKFAGRKERGSVDWLRAITPFGMTLAMCLIPIALGTLWVGYTDAIKSLNPYGALLTSQALAGWNFGTLEQRVSEAFWGTVVGRTLPEALGYGVWLAPLVVVAAMIVGRVSAPIIIFMLGFLTPLVVFTNLHAVHNYYQYANGVFLILALGSAIAALAQDYSRPLAAGLGVIFVAGNVTLFWSDYLPLLRVDWQQNETIQIAQKVQDHTPPDSGLVLIGADWSSEIPYYSQRRMLALAAWFPADTVARSLEAPQSALGESAFAGVVACGGPERYPEPLRTTIERFLFGRSVVAEAGTCRLLTADRPMADHPIPPPSVTRILAGATAERAEFAPTVMEEGVFAHAPARLVAKVQGPRSLEGTFGYVDAAWQTGNPVPVIFSISLRNAEAETLLFKRELNPARSADDRGPQAFSIDVPEGEATLVFETETSSGDNAWAWTYWGNAR
ncbi:phospholipid carrier-dependent glycosyltransferase [Thalassobaculum litoreum]|uniref:Dolichyl-phosphate-mannose-protein mannosyltransferase n=1 Tax=Thalassobaculum litoreum DSM 18839 TaxID=1123362 RepID=A0A8G2BNR2_9PROT|nr:phospholipid carrier-dependent glycosyltransferase [Thalassobaculum litoreum]SDG62157.1 Dolichyl-phosphate-mannose-protein mannosyltransferase [Thalassobaculum litoreum DSM 18839]